MEADALNEQHWRALATHVVAEPTATMLEGECFVHAHGFWGVTENLTFVVGAEVTRLKLR